MKIKKLLIHTCVTLLNSVNFINKINTDSDNHPSWAANVMYQKQCVSKVCF